ncbi:MAG: hypothetical protein GF421_08225 [Candidatus Aminicenantes bacterium]|nr:hypothetical protein [Candidatus Aminicenantes bacterium]
MMTFRKICSHLLVLCVLCFISKPSGLCREHTKAVKKINIITSVYPLKEFAQAVFGKKAEVKMLIPPGAEVHTWKPKPSDILRFSKADLFVYIGASMEPWLDDIIESTGRRDLILIEAVKGFHLIKEQQNRFDPHVWLEFEYDQQIVDKIIQTASSMQPENKMYFEQNGKEYKNKLKDLDELYQNTLTCCEVRSFIIGGHSAFGYLARRYNLIQISVHGLSPDSTPSPKHIKEIIEMAKQNHIDIIYYQEYVNDQIARMLADEINAQTMRLNPGANLSENQIRSNLTFIEVMKKNLENLKYGLRCK